MPDVSPAPDTDPVKFWGDDPNILLDPKHVFELWPVESMSFNQKLNAITRGVVLLSAAMFAVYRNGRLLAVCALTVVAIYCMQRTVVRGSQHAIAEPFGASNVDDAYKTLAASNGAQLLPVVFQPSSADNPFANVLPGDYDAAAAKQPAAPAYNAAASADILSSVYSQINATHSSYPNISADLVADKYDSFGFEQSMRPFYSTASTTIPNDQGAFADFCYGATLSCLKDSVNCVAGNTVACTNRAQSCDNGNLFTRERAKAM
jgi:hypothetical protein